MVQESETAKNEQVKLLFQEIEKQVKARNFFEAEKIREKLMEAAPSALNEILQAAEIIEQAMAKGLDQNHLSIWKDLYEEFTDEEKNLFFYSLKKVVIPPKKIILKHGSYNRRLFLINSGQVSIVHPKKDGTNVVVAQLGRGELIGEYTFTTISLCSASVVSNTEVELMVLDNSIVNLWNEKVSTLYNKVVHFCEHNGKVDEIIRQKQMEKRTHTRYNTKGDVHATILTKEGKKSNSSFRGLLSNISMVGCCIEIHCSKKETARAMLARQIYMKIIVEKGGQRNQISTTGKIIRLSFHLHNDYSVHVHFNNELKKEQLALLV